MLNIKQVHDCRTGDIVVFKAVVSEKKMLTSTNGKEFLQLTFIDAYDRIKTPIFEDPDKYEELTEGTPYVISAKINIWNNIVQLKEIEFRELSYNEYKSEDFISSYKIPEKDILYFKDKIESLSEPYKSIAKSAMYDNDFFTHQFLVAPSAEKYHGNKLGGLFLHTVTMLKIMDEIIEVYKDNVYGDFKSVVNTDRLCLKVIFHDIMKTREYKYSTFIKRKEGAVGHLIDGCTFLHAVNNRTTVENKLNEEEMENIKYAILSHHGQYGPYEPKTIEDQILHQLDMIDSKIVGALEDNAK